MGRISYDEQDKYESSGNGEWFSLKNDGDIARVQFMADSPDDLEIFACHRVKIGEKERYVDCLRSYNDPIDVCPLCAAGVPVKPVRFVVMYQHDDGKVKIWERGKQFIGKLRGKNLQVGGGSPCGAHPEQTAEPEVKAGGRDKVLCGKPGFWYHIP